MRLGILPRDFDALTPPDWAVYVDGALEREDARWELAAWMVAQCAGTVGRRLRQPVTLATLIPGVWARQEARRDRAAGRQVKKG